ncbi:hypothetical protein, partial [Bacteriovorax sp. DB6_IX]|uniref:hypothetical protein n=1 Tax=Bacteriovorax sp. DB6_IX TaxID=1353530 RepID=UPI001E3C98AA
PSIANNYIGFTPRVLKRFENCGLQLPEKKLPDSIRYKYELYIIKKCLANMIRKNIKNADFQKYSIFQRLMGEDLEITLRFVSLGPKKKVRLAYVSFWNRLNWENTDQLYRPTNLCRTERHKKECKFWEEYFQKNGWDAPYRKTNFPVVPNSEIEKLVKDKIEYIDKN